MSLWERKLETSRCRRLLSQRPHISLLTEFAPKSFSGVCRRPYLGRPMSSSAWPADCSVPSACPRPLPPPPCCCLPRVSDGVGFGPFGDGSSPPGWSLSSGKARGVLWGPRPPVLSALHGLGPLCLGSTPFSVWPKSVSSAILTSLWTFFPSRSFPLETCFCLYHVSMITDRRQAPNLQKGPPLDGVETAPY